MFQKMIKDEKYNKRTRNQLKKLKQQQNLENPVTIDNEDNF